MPAAEYERLYAVLVDLNDGDVDATNVSVEVRKVLGEFVELYERTYRKTGDDLRTALHEAEAAKRRAELAELEAMLARK